MIGIELWRWIKLVEVVCRLTCTYLVRRPGQIAGKRQRDQGVEYHLAGWYRQGRLRKRAVGPLAAYYLSSGKPGVRGNLAHDLYAGLAAAKLYAEIKGRAGAELVREPCGDSVADWTLRVDLGAMYRYFLEFHSARNTDRAVASTIGAYEEHLQASDFVLIITETAGYVPLPSDQFMHVVLADHLSSGDSWQAPIWRWGKRSGRYSLLEA